MTENAKGKKVYQVDVFTSSVFGGSPAAVMIVDSMPSESYMQDLAMEMNLSETAFVVPEEGSFRIRFFTPKAEIPLAGHPTLASAHILYELGIVSPSEEIVFEANVATMKVKMENGSIAMNFPAFPLEQIQIDPSFKGIVGFQPIEMYQSSYNWKIAVADSVETIINSAPHFSKMGDAGIGHLIITAKSISGNEDFVARCFAPDLGVNEDPVTGSAHCALTPLWAKKMDKSEMRSKQLSQRTGELTVKLIGERVELIGKAVTVFEAVLR